MTNHRDWKPSHCQSLELVFKTPGKLSLLWLHLMIRDILAQFVIRGPPAVFSQSLSFSFSLLRKDHLTTVHNPSMGRLFVVLLNHWQTSLHTLSQLLAGQPISQTATCKCCTWARGQAGCWLGGKDYRGSGNWGQGGRNRPLNPLIAWVVLSSCCGDRVSRGRRWREGELCSLGPDGVMFGGKVTDPVNSCGPVTLYDDGKHTTSSKVDLLSTECLPCAIWCYTLSLLFKITAV